MKKVFLAYFGIALFFGVIFFEIAGIIHTKASIKKGAAWLEAHNLEPKQAGYLYLAEDKK